MELTGKGNNILDKAEDVILRGVEKLLDTPEKLTTEDCRNSKRWYARRGESRRSEAGISTATTQIRTGRSESRPTRSNPADPQCWSCPIQYSR